MHDIRFTSIETKNKHRILRKLFQIYISIAHRNSMKILNEFCYDEIQRFTTEYFNQKILYLG